LDAFASREVLGPLGLERTLFRPPPALRPRIAPTGAWHGHPVAGVVNDQNAAKLGGVAGHAGLFGTATDLARFAQFMLRRGALPDGRHLVTPETVRLFTTKAVDFGRGTEARALGWQAVPTGAKTGSAGLPVGPGTPARHRPVPGPGTRGGFRHPAHGARRGDASRASRRTRVRRRRRSARAAAALAGKALARLAVLVAGRTAPREAGLRVDRPPAPLPGAWLPGSLAWRKGGRGILYDSCDAQRRRRAHGPAAGEGPGARPEH